MANPQLVDKLFGEHDKVTCYENWRKESWGILDNIPHIFNCACPSTSFSIYNAIAKYK